MSFREKTAWITLFAIVIVSLMYWFHIPSLFAPHSPRLVLHAMGASLVAYILIEAVSYMVLRLRNPQDARTPKDERERLIDLKSLRIAYYVFVCGSLIGIFMALHLVGAGAVGLGMTVFGAFVLAQLGKHIARIVYYRRGA
jgi:hypothetical protein